MDKILLHSDEEYFEFCERNQIGYIARIYTPQSCKIEMGIECNKDVTLYKGTAHEEYLNINVKPFRYPCILALYKDCIGEDIQNEIGIFIYPEDFEGFSKFDENF